MKKDVYVDMDGVLAKWNTEASIEEVATAGYFRGCAPMANMLKAIDMLISENICKVYILSAVFRDEHSATDKHIWLDKYLPSMEYSNRLFVPYGDSKYEYIKERGSNKPFLIDDFTKNLLEWEGIGIKCLNGINNTKGTWKGYFVNADSEPQFIYNTLKGILAVE